MEADDTARRKKRDLSASKHLMRLARHSRGQNAIYD
jgi:hypothetical protein